MRGCRSLGLSQVICQLGHGLGVPEGRVSECDFM